MHQYHQTINTPAGHRSNFTVIIPSYDLVVVRRGLDKQATGNGFGQWTSAAEVLKVFSHQ